MPGLKNAKGAPQETFGLVQDAHGLVKTDVTINAACVDPLNPSGVPTELRAGLVLGRIAASNEYINYDQSAGDGSQDLKHIVVLKQEVHMDGVNPLRATVCFSGGLLNRVLLKFTDLASEGAFDAGQPAHIKTISVVR